MANVVRLPIVESTGGGDPPATERPRRRGDCLAGGSNAARPCPWVSCRYHLYLDIVHKNRLITPHGNVDVDEIPETCALDVADSGPQSERRVAALMGVVHQRANQLEIAALAKLAARAKRERRARELRDRHLNDRPIVLNRRRLP